MRHVHLDRQHTYTLESTVTESGTGLCHGTADGQAVYGGAGAATLIGICPAESGTIGDPVDLVRSGFVMARVNGNSVNIARGDKLKVAATTGRFVKAATDKDYYFLEAQEAATADGVLISALITRGYLAA